MSLPFEIENIRPQISSAIEGFGADLLDIFYKRFGNRSTVTFIVDKPGGVTLEDCVRINHRLGEMFDELSGENGGEDALIQGSYFLEVNSPGLDRPLKSQRDFERAVGNTVTVFYRDEATGTFKENTGEILKVENGAVHLIKPADNKVFWVKLDVITKAVKEIKFKR